MKLPALPSYPLTERNVYTALFTLGFAFYPLMALTTHRAHRAIPLFLFLVAVVALCRKVRAWSPDLTRWAWALALLSGPFYLAYLFGEVEAPTLERISYGWMFLVIGAAACAVRPNLHLFVGALVAGAFATLTVQLITGGHRPSLDFNPIPYAEVAAAFFCLLCVCICRLKRPLMILAIGVGLVAWVIVIVLTETRGAILAILPGIAFILWHFGKRFGPRISLGAFLGICALAWVGDTLLNNVISQRFQLAAADVQQYRDQPHTFSSTAVRIELWRASLMLVQEYPMGQGEDGAKATALEWLQEGKLQRYIEPQLKVAHFHSDFFQQLAVAGYIGLVSLLLFYGLLIRHFFQHRAQLAGAMGLVFTLSYIVSGFTDVPLYNRLTLFSFFMIITLCIVSIRRRRKTTPASSRAASSSFRENHVIPAQAGIHRAAWHKPNDKTWIPAYAGMTNRAE